MQIQLRLDPVVVAAMNSFVRLVGSWFDLCLIEAYYAICQVGQTWQMFVMEVGPLLA